MQKTIQDQTKTNTQLTQICSNTLDHLACNYNHQFNHKSFYLQSCLNQKENKLQYKWSIFLMTNNLNQENYQKENQNLSVKNIDNR